MKNQTILQNNNEHTFKKLPDFLFSDPNYNHISNDAKLLYSFLLNRHGLSKKNQDTYSDEQGIYIIYTRENMAIALKCSTKKVTRLMRELRITGLVRERKMGLNKPNHIYVQTPEKEIETSAATKTPIFHGHDTMSGHEATISAIQNKTNSRTNKIENNNIKHQSSDNADLLKSFQSISNKKKKNEKKNDQQKYIKTQEKVKKQINFDHSFAFSDKDTLKKVKSLIAIMIDVYTTKKQTIRVNCQEMEIEFIRKQFEKIDQTCIDFALESLSRVSTNIRDIRAYLRTTLYNTLDVAEMYFQTSTGL
jgi:Replication initiator protein A (RepA) N-terminus.